ncbi:DMT family transporter [Rhizosaccharibacter radicis]|uniref:DMT family transporter n=1 Tax=Rhizosaccharibacter radicis TaxID=2782605 RepID=A0ABT1VTX6_9PROT|nr:DMT family transporter [Acetobacteraceae bacterium KSS12]
MRPSATTALVLAILVAVLSWASAYPVVRIALSGLAPVPLAAVRYAVASVLALGWLFWRKRVPAARDLPRFAACGFFGISLYNVLFNTGEQTVSAGAASLLISAAPLMAALLATLLLGERLTVWGWTGSLVSFGGVSLIAGGQSGGLSFGSGASIILGAALSAAIFTTLQKPLIVRYGALDATAVILLMGDLFLLPALPAGLREMQAASPTILAAVLVLGIFPAAIGYAAWGYVIGRMGAARAVGLLYLLPPTTLLLAFLLTAEVPSARTLLGGAVVMTGVVLMNTLGRARPAAAPVSATAAGR